MEDNKLPDTDAFDQRARSGLDEPAGDLFGGHGSLFEKRRSPPVVSVLVPVAVAGTYSYAVPDGLSVAPGDLVTVPLGTREVVGVVWDDPPDAEIGHNRLRAILGRLEAAPRLSKEIRAFVDWVANYTLTTRGMVLRMVLRAPGALLPERSAAGVRGRPASVAVN